MSAHDWQERAACRDAREEIFFDDTGVAAARPAMTARARRWRAKQYCVRCPVARLCLDHALRTRIEFGVYGGLDSRQRLNLRREETKPAVTAEAAFALADGGWPWRRIGDHLRADGRRLYGATHRWRRTAQGKLASREYEAWASVAEGRPPGEVARLHSLPIKHAEDMCHIMDGLPEYDGPRGRDRHVRRN